jgi:hypothetical protein
MHGDLLIVDHKDFFMHITTLFYPESEHVDRFNPMSDGEEEYMKWGEPARAVIIHIGATKEKFFQDLFLDIEWMTPAENKRNDRPIKTCPIHHIDRV